MFLDDRYIGLVDDDTRRSRAGSHPDGDLYDELTEREAEEAREAEELYRMHEQMAR